MLGETLHYTNESVNYTSLPFKTGLQENVTMLFGTVNYDSYP